MRFAYIATLCTFVAGQALAGEWLCLHQDVLENAASMSAAETSIFTVPAGGNNNNNAAASAEGQACTQSIEGSVADGTCNDIGQCVVQSPPNIEQRFKNDQCA